MSGIFCVCFWSIIKLYGYYQRCDTPLYGNDQRCDIYGDEDYIDEVFSTDDLGRRQKYREAIRQMEQLLLAIAEIE